MKFFLVVVVGCGDTPSFPPYHRVPLLIIEGVHYISG